MTGKEVEKSESVMALGLFEGKNIHLVFFDCGFVHWQDDADVILGNTFSDWEFHEVVQSHIEDSGVLQLIGTFAFLEGFIWVD